MALIFGIKKNDHVVLELCRQKVLLNHNAIQNREFFLRNVLHLWHHVHFCETIRAV